MRVRRTRRWGAALAVVAAAALSACGGDEHPDEDACRGTVIVEAASLVPDGPFQARPLSAEQVEQVEAGFVVEGAEVDSTRVVDTRDRAAFVLIVTTSTAEEVRDVDVFAGFTNGTEEQGSEVEETKMDGRPARLARIDGRTTIIATKDGCSTVTLLGVEDEPTRDLAAELEL